MITVQEAIEIHSILIERFGGTNGLRDKGLLESALNRPFQTFDETELYPTAIEKATALIESIIMNHPFTDGNKRTGYVLARLTLMNESIDINAEHQDKYEFVISISKGELSFDEIKMWLEKHSR